MLHSETVKMPFSINIINSGSKKKLLKKFCGRASAPSVDIKAHSKVRNHNNSFFSRCLNMIDVIILYYFPFLLIDSPKSYMLDLVK